MIDYIDTKDLHILKSDSMDTLKHIDMSKPLTREQFLLVGSSLAILNHGTGKHLDSRDDVYSNHELIRKIKLLLDLAEDFLTDYRLTNDRDYVQASYDLSTYVEKFVKIAEKYGYDVKCKRDWLIDLQERIAKLSQ